MPTPQMLMLQMPQMQPVLMQSTQSIESVLMPLQKQMRPVLMCSNLMLLVLVWLMRMVDWCGLWRVPPPVAALSGRIAIDEPMRCSFVLRGRTRMILFPRRQSNRRWQR